MRSIRMLSAFMARQRSSVRLVSRLYLMPASGFAGVLAELNLPTAQFAWALLQFNVGLEVGQLMIVIAATMLLFLLRERPRYSQWAIGGGSTAAMTVGVLWFIERTTDLSLLPL